MKWRYKVQSYSETSPNGDLTLTDTYKNSERLFWEKPQNVYKLNPLNSGQHFGEQKCPVFRDFSISLYLYYIIYYYVGHTYYNCGLTMIILKWFNFDLTNLVEFFKEANLETLFKNLKFKTQTSNQPVN